MKLLYDDSKIHSNLNTKNFKVSEDPNKIMMIFSNGFYKHPVKSAFREIFANAVDEHLKYNISKPVRIFVGSRDNPFTDFNYYVSIRDYAKGLSKEEVDSLYTTFFLSSKDKSNTQWGAFGLGSKSPFAVHTEFIVRSYHNGTMTEYLMVRTDVDLKYIVINETETDETGLEVLFPVSDNNFSFIHDVLIPLNPEIRYEFNTDSATIAKLYIKSLINAFIYLPEKKVLVTPALSQFSRPCIYYSFQIRSMSSLGDIIYYPDIGELKLTPNRDSIVEDSHYEEVLNTAKDIIQYVREKYDKVMLYCMHSYPNQKIIVADPKEVDINKLKQIILKRSTLTGMVLTEEELLLLKKQIQDVLGIDPDNVLPEIIDNEHVKKRFRSVLKYSQQIEREIKYRTIRYIKDGQEKAKRVEKDKVLHNIIELYKQGIRTFIANSAFKSSISCNIKTGTRITLDYIISKEIPEFEAYINTCNFRKEIDLFSSETIKEAHILIVSNKKYPEFQPKTVFENQLGRVNKIFVLDDFIILSQEFPTIPSHRYDRLEIRMYISKNVPKSFISMSLVDKIKYCRNNKFPVKLVSIFRNKEVTDYDPIINTIMESLQIINLLKENTKLKEKSND